jgi:hypothetical protein
MPDVEITCAECGTPFPFTEREQEYYTERNLSQPKRCKACRDSRRANFGGGGRGAGGERQRFEITCDQCGKTDSVVVVLVRKIRREQISCQSRIENLVVCSVNH